MADKKTLHITTVNRVYLIIAMFVMLIVMLILLIQMQMNVLIAVRAYTGGEGLWAKAQKDATRSLEHYALTHNEDDYESYLSFLQVPLGDLKSRIELQKPEPNLDIVREGFIAGGNDPEDIEGMINLFLRFQHISFMADAIDHWTLADHYIEELNDEAKKLHQEIILGHSKPETVHTLLVRLNVINRHLTEQENIFSSTLAKASRIVNDITRIFTYVFALLFSLLGIAVSWPIIKRIRVAENELRKSEADLRISATAFESQESMLITDADTVILRVNQAFTVETGYAPEEVIGQTPRLLKSTRHNEEFYRSMWESINLTGKWEGEIWDRRKNGEEYPKWLTISAVKRDDGLVTHYVGSHFDITLRKLAESEINNLAFYDPLTRLPNRRLLIDRLQQALPSAARSGRKGAVLFVDLDNFKILNDDFGHDAGDLLLQQTAQRLEACVREGDTVARLGGDEFVVILVDLSEHSLEAAKQTETIGNKILTSLRQSYQLAKLEYLNTPSIGVTLFSDNLQTLDELMKQADIAMYQAKNEGRNTMRFYDPALHKASNTRSSF